MISLRDLRAKFNKQITDRKFQRNFRKRRPELAEG